MGNTLTLDDFNQMLEDGYGPLKLEGWPGGDSDILLLPIMRLTRERRAQFSEALSKLSAQERAEEAARESGEDNATDLNATVDSITGLLALVCEKPKDMDRIKRALGDDGQAMLTLWEKYQEATKLGEASPSGS